MSHAKPIVLILSEDAEFGVELAAQCAGIEEVRVETSSLSADRRDELLERAALVVIDTSTTAEALGATIAGIRANGVDAPIIALVVASLAEPCADDGTEFMRKPLRLSQLLNRLRARLRMRDNADSAELRIGPFAFHHAGKALVANDGCKLRLTEKEAAILLYLYRAGERPVSREELLREVWGYNSGVSTHTLETHIYRLRQKIEADAAAPTLLITETGGYRLDL